MQPSIVLILITVSTNAQRILPQDLQLEERSPFNINQSAPTKMPTSYAHLQSHTTAAESSGVSGHGYFYIHCITVQWVPNLDYSGRIHKFHTVGVYSCWLYCDALVRCSILTYNMVTGECSLFSYNYEPEVQNISDDVARTVLTYIKYCVENATGKIIPDASFQEVMSLSKNGTGILMEQYFAGQRTCLSVKKGPGDEDMIVDEDDWLARYKVYNLTWKPCEKADKWIIQEIRKGSYYHTDLDKTYQISLASHPHYCLDVKIRMDYESEVPIAVLKRCVDFKSINSDLNTQSLVVVGNLNEFNFVGEVFSIFSSIRDESMLPGDWAIVFTEQILDYSKSIYGLYFRDPVYYAKKFTLCPLSQYSIPHGTVYNNHKIPFVLPGRSLDITCDAGYGVRGSEDTSIQSFVCVEGGKPEPCKKKHRKKNIQKVEEIENNPVLLIVTIVSLVFSVVLAAALIKTHCRVKEGEDIVKNDLQLNGPSCPEKNKANNFPKNVGPV